MNKSVWIQSKTYHKMDVSLFKFSGALSLSRKSEAQHSASFVRLTPRWRIAVSLIDSDVSWPRNQLTLFSFFFYTFLPSIFVSGLDGKKTCSEIAFCSFPVSDWKRVAICSCTQLISRFHPQAEFYCSDKRTRKFPVHQRSFHVYKTLPQVFPNTIQMNSTVQVLRRTLPWSQNFKV